MQSDNGHILRLLIASPGDVATERDAVERAALRVANRRKDMAIKVFRWEDNPPTQGDAPQSEVERHIPAFESLDIVVVICWSRYGTLGQDGQSGTDREFTRAFNARKQKRRPEIMAYHCTNGISPASLDVDQVRLLQQFIAKMQATGILKTYVDKSQFESMFEDHLEKLVNALDKNNLPRREGQAVAATSVRDSANLLKRIEEAAVRIAPRIYRTPLVRSKRLEQDLNCKRVMLKLEPIQVTGSFKVRGAMNAVALHAEDRSIEAFATASAGNHGLGLAYSAARWNKDAHVYMPQRTPLTKRRAIERYTSNITLFGATFEETKEHALREAAQHGYKFIHPYNDLDVIAGQGTLGLELVQDINDYYGGQAPDIVVVPAGGGGLVAGVATVVKHTWPKCRVVAAEAANIPSLDAAMKTGAPVAVKGTGTFADGIAVAEVGDISFGVLRGVVDEVWTVSEESMARAVVRMIDDIRVIAEGAGACGLGGVFDKHTSDAAAISNKSIVIVVSGGNLDTVALTKLLQRGLVLSQRLVHLRFVAPDVPGALAKITGDLGDIQINILDLWHSRLDAGVRVGATHVHVVVEARDGTHVESIVNALRQRKHDVKLIVE